MSNNNGENSNRFENSHNGTELLQLLMRYSEHIIIFYEPIFQLDEVIDFKVIYFNSSAKSIWNIQHIDEENMSIGNMFPELAKSYGKSFLKHVWTSQTTEKRVDRFSVNNKKVILKTVAQPTEYGVFTTISNVSENQELKNQLVSSGVKFEKKVQELQDARSFTQSVLDSSNNIITFFLPIYGKNEEITDFKISYINERIEEAIGKKVDRIIGRSFTEFYPKGLENGDFKRMVKCFSNDEKIEISKDFVISGTQYFFSSRMLKLDNGLLLFSKDITNERKYEIELGIRNRMLSRAESLSGVGSFRWNIETGHFTFSDNYYSILGFDSKDFSPSRDKFIQYIHPDDLVRVEAAIAKSIKLNEAFNIKYRLKFDSNNIKTVNAVGKLYNKNGQQMMVGAIKDITLEIETRLNLEQQNIVLEQSNQELASFNRVASHDLQEPLRKIQMFTNRILDKDEGHLSADSIKFLDKISSASQRMRLLINNLLSYSKVSDASKGITRVDLNKVLLHVLDNLEERIRETNTVVFADKLPSIFGIEFQLEQILTNLLSNSIKYRKADISPKIWITSEIIKFENVNSKFQLPRSQYLMIKIKDNGIGFEKEYAEKIFEMFQRLHVKHEYSGTGLGLSIAKKIIQNHKGHIEASAIPDKGAIFTIYLPYTN